MPAVQASAPLAGNERGASARCSGENERPLFRNGLSRWASDENQAPPTVPKAFESMLKTTTETGEIGLFSIKPSRVPQSVNGLRRFGGTFRDSASQRPRNLQSYGTTGIDDRRWLPSYARDASSEVISMYETASQKSASRVFDDPNSRSYSMTQTYSTYSLSNHRSYARLRGQPEGSTLLQRPRSPFAYPTRLKRPGFRPSSPALTDEGEVDYSRRAEIDRIPYAGGARSASSPSSLYAWKRKPPSLLRPDACRSTPSLLNQSSPARCSISPHMGQGVCTPTIDWQGRSGTGSFNTSPARSTISLASTVNLYQTAPVISTTTTPGRPPSSPLYYDYTEDFDIDDYNRPEMQDPPPQFRIEKTIPEDRPMSSGWQPNEDPDIAGPKTIFTERPKSSVAKSLSFQDSQKPSHDSTCGSHDGGNVFDGTQTRCKPRIALAGDSVANQSISDAKTRKVIRLSGLGLGAQELNRDVEEAFGLVSSPSFELVIPSATDDPHGEASSRLRNSSGCPFDGDADNDVHSPSTRTSVCSLNAHLKRFPAPPFAMGSLVGMELTPKETKIAYGKPATILSNLEMNTENLPAPPTALPAKDFMKSHYAEGITAPLGSTQLRTTGRGDSGNRSRSSHDDQVLHGTPQKTSKFLLNLLDESPLHRISALNITTNPLSSNRQPRNSRLHLGKSIKIRDHCGKATKLEAATLPVHGDTNVPNFSHQIPRKFMSRSEAPMLAPKPISPARQLKLKNSIPQLMKALPPLPPEPSILCLSPPQQLTATEGFLPYRLSPLITDSNSTSAEVTIEIAKPIAGTFHAKGVLRLPDLVALGSKPAITMNETRGDEETQAPLKLKLKMRSSTIIRPTSPPDSRPWNLEENYPWSGQKTPLGLPLSARDEKVENSKPPKFKLKITRASNSTLGTVRVNRNSTFGTKVSTGLHFRSPKDLFTPNAGLDGIFRQVSKHLHPRRNGVSSSRSSPDDKLMPPVYCGFKSVRPSAPEEYDIQPSPMSSVPLIPLDARSCFSEAGFKPPDRPNARKRLTDLRARVTVPYTSRVGSQSYDNITWKVRHRRPLPATPASDSHPNLPSGRSGTDFPRHRRFTIQAQKIKAKISPWFNVACSRISARVKSRHGTERAKEDQVHFR